MRLSIFVALILTAGFCFAQTIRTVKRGSKDYLAIVNAAKAKFQTAAAAPIRTPAGRIIDCEGYAYLRERLRFVDPKRVGDGDGMALLKRVRGKWRVVEWNVGSGGMEDLAAEWTKKYKLPKGLAY